MVMRSRVLQLTLATMAGAYLGVAFAMRTIDATIAGAGEHS
jgi:hypothetical protein